MLQCLFILRSNILYEVIICLLYHLVDNYTVLQIGNVTVISEAYHRLFNFGAETLQRDYDLERTFNYSVINICLLV